MSTLQLSPEALEREGQGATAPSFFTCLKGKSAGGGASGKRQSEGEASDMGLCQKGQGRDGAMVQEPVPLSPPHF